jgi:hypothetical protein
MCIWFLAVETQSGFIRLIEGGGFGVREFPAAGVKLNDLAPAKFNEDCNKCYGTTLVVPEKQQKYAGL